MNPNIPYSDNKRIVIAGGGFAGLKLASKLAGSKFQVVLIDKYNYHQFQPLMYQVATAGLEPSSISFPLRKIFQKYKNVHIRITEIKEIVNETKTVITTIGEIKYDYLVLALGVDTNYFGLEQLKKNSFPLKTVSESLSLRNNILNNYEKALIQDDDTERQSYLNIVIVGGGPTGIEMAGAVAEMRNTILPKDYHEIDFSKMNIYLIEASEQLLTLMSEQASRKAKEYLEKLGVTVILNCKVKDYDGFKVHTNTNYELYTRNLVWTSGITGNTIKGLDSAEIKRGNRIITDKFNRVKNYSDIYAIGDISFVEDEQYPNGHPQVAPAAIQQAKTLARNFALMKANKPLKEFKYIDYGTMATIGRNLAVVDLPFMKLQGMFAWLIWMFVHLMSIVGVKNRLLIFINWFWNYFTHDQSLRLIMRPKPCEDKSE